MSSDQEQGVEQVFQPSSTTKQQEEQPPKQVIVEKITTQQAHWHQPPRQYIIDRCQGESKYDTHKRPPSRLCFPPPCLKTCPGLLEQNGCCEFAGECGTAVSDDKIRRHVFGIALGANIVAFVFNFFACFSMATEFNMLRAASFSMGRHVTADNGAVDIFVGLRGVAFVNERFPGGSSYALSEFCGGTPDPIDGAVVSNYSCATCTRISNALVSCIVLSLVLIIPSILSNVNRMYANYDVNCQKCTGVLVTAMSLVFSIYTFVGYNRRQCFETFGIEDDGSTLFMHWEPGNGLVSMYVVTALKIMDLLAQLIVATPEITRDHAEQQNYESMYGPSQQQAEQRMEQPVAARQAVVPTQQPKQDDEEEPEELPGELHWTSMRMEQPMEIQHVDS